MQIYTKIDLDLLRPAVQVIVNAKQNDKSSRFIQANLWEGGQPFAPGSVLATFRVLKPDGTAAFYDTNENGDPAITLSGNVATVELVEQVLTVPGDVAAELNLYTGTGEKLTSFTFTIRVQASVLNDADISSSDYFNILTSTLAQAEAAADRAEAAADRAEDLSSGSVKSVNGQLPDNSGAVSIDVGVMTVNNQSPDENGNVNVQAGVRPNLLDNWYFGNPVNQRGQTEYTGAGYGIDRWRATAQSGKVLLLENAVRVSTSNDSTPGWFCQILENPTAFSGKTVTFSMLVTTQDASSWRIAFEDATTAGGSGNYAIEDFKLAAGETALISVTKKIDVGVAVSLLQNRDSTEKYVDILAAKLELGEGQTLAHQDGYGNWVLNEISDYAGELAKCQRYQYVISGYCSVSGVLTNSKSALILSLPTPTSMRTKPAVTGVTISGVRTVTGSNITPEVSSFSVDSFTSQCVNLNVITSTFNTDTYTNNTPIFCYVRTAVLDANL